MEQKKEFERKLCSLKDKLCAMLESGSYQLDSEEGGALVDEIKDLADAEKNLWKAGYYKCMMEAMKEEKEKEKMMGPMGYDNWRYSSGRFAPTGRGHYDPAGYSRPMEIHDYNRMQYPNLREMVDRMGYEGMGEYEMMRMMDSMGYSGSGRGGSGGGRGGSSGGSSGGGSRGGSGGSSGGGSSSGSSGSSSGGSGGSSGYSRYGYSYDKFNESRRHYKESKDSRDKEEMNQHANEHVMDTLDTMRDIWKDADPQLQKRMKSELASLIQDMN